MRFKVIATCNEHTIFKTEGQRGFVGYASNSSRVQDLIEGYLDIIHANYTYAWEKYGSCGFMLNKVSTYQCCQISTQKLSDAGYVVSIEISEE